MLPAESGGQRVDAALTSAPNRFYLTGFKSSAGYVLVTREEAYLLVDFRYAEAAAAQVKDARVRLFSKLSETLAELISAYGLRGILLESGAFPAGGGEAREDVRTGRGARRQNERTR